MLETSKHPSPNMIRLLGLWQLDSNTLFCIILSKNCCIFTATFYLKACWNLFCIRCISCSISHTAQKVGGVKKGNMTQHENDTPARQPTDRSSYILTRNAEMSTNQLIFTISTHDERHWFHGFML